MYTAMTVLFWVLAAILGILTAVNPSTLWWKTSAWRYSNPEANEPSDAAYSMSRVTTGICALIMAGMGCWLGSAKDPNGLGSGDVYDAAVQAAHDLEGQRYAWSGPSEFDVEQALDKDHDYGDLQADRYEGGAAGRIYFQVTNAKGKHPACIETYRLDGNGDVIYDPASPSPSARPSLWASPSPSASLSPWVGPSPSMGAASASGGSADAKNTRIKAHARKGACPGYSAVAPSEHA